MKYFKYILIATTLTIFTVETRAEFVFAHINESIMPIDRGAKYEDPLDAYLRKKDIGEVTGGGSSLSTTGGIEWVGVDIELSAPHKNIERIAIKLRELGAPPGSFLEYTVDDRNHKVVVK